MEIRAGYKKTEVGVIPEDWEVISLGDFFDFKNGLNKEKQYFGQGTPIVNYMDVYKKSGLTSMELTGKVTLTSQEIKNYEVKKGDVFFTRTSETVDEIGISAVMLEDVKDTVFSGFVLRARPIKDKLDIDFKKYCFSTKEVRKEITSKSSYTTRALTNGRLLSGVKMAIPPTLTEQTAIANALSDADALITSLEKLIAKKCNIKQGAMQKLLQPKEGWEVKRLGEIAEVATGTTPPTKNLDNYGEDYCFVSPADLGRIKYILNTEKKLSKKGFGISRRFPKYSILFTCIGSTIGKSGITNFEMTSNQQINAVFPNDSYSTEFLYYSLNLISEQIKLSASEQALPMINKTEFEKILIQLPTKEEQTRIAIILSDMDNEITTLENKLEKYKKIKLGMMQNLLTGRIRLI